MLETDKPTPKIIPLIKEIILDIIAFYPISFTVIIAVIIKITVAVIDLNDKRLMPQMPWPLVQPLPIFVPMPTKKPPIIIIGSDDVIKKEILFFVKNAYKIGPKTKPTINKKLSVLFCFETRTLFTMPLMPANRPFPIKNIITAKPIIIPPIKADCGVKFIISINLIGQSIDYTV